MQPLKFGIGQSVLRKEDDALIRGHGRYVADHAPAGVLHAVTLRSPHAHARFRISDLDRARALPGVTLNAILYALWRAYRIGHVDMPATAERIWAAIAEAKRRHTL